MIIITSVLKKINMISAREALLDRAGASGYNEDNKESDDGKKVFAC